jgi:hypothetical protein
MTCKPSLTENGFYICTFFGYFVGTSECLIAYKDWNWENQNFSVHPVHSNAVSFTKYLSTKY